MSSTSPSVGGEGALPLRQSARLRRSALETADETRVLNERNLRRDAENIAPEVNGNSSQGKDSGRGKLPYVLDSQQPNGRLVNRVNNNQAVRKGIRPLNRGKSPVRGAKPAKTSIICLAVRIVRIIFKWFILLTILGASGWGLWNWVLKPYLISFPNAGDILNEGRVDILNEGRVDILNEGRVVELEAFLKKTMKMLQVQLDLVDLKYEKEVEGLKKKLEESIEDQADAFYTELSNLKVKTSDIEESLLKLKDSEVLSRQEVLGLVNYVVDARASKGDGQVLSLDDVRAVARRLVEAEIERHAADGLGRVDYALGRCGGRVVQHSEGYLLGSGRKWGLSSSLDFLRKSVSSLHPYAEKMLEPNFGEPGHCLPLKGSKVFVLIALRTSIFAEAVTLEHVAKSVAYDRSSAPKDFRIFGWLESLQEGMSEEVQKMFLLGEFTYDLKKSSAQTFNLPAESTGKLVNMIKLDVQSNHGSSSHTCIYRLRVHGKEPEFLRPAEIEA